MKYNTRIFVKLLVYIFCILAIDACSDTYTDGYFATKNNYNVNFGTSRLVDMDAEGETAYVNLQASDNVEWQISSLPDWLKVTPTSGKGNTELAFIASKNPSFDDARTAIFHFKSNSSEWPMSKDITVSQKARTKKLSMTPSATAAYQFTYTGGSVDLVITSNIEWELYADADFVSFSQKTGSGDGSAIMTIASNNTDDITPRTAHVYLREKGTSTAFQTQTITQNTKKNSVSTHIEKVSFDSKASQKGFYSLGSTTNGFKTSVTQSWLGITPSEGTGEISVSINVVENNSFEERIGHAYIYLNDSPEPFYDFVVTQEGKDAARLTVTPESLTFSNDGGTQNISVVSNYTWIASCDADWLSLSTTTGSGNNSISVTAKSNSSTSQRSANITITCEGATKVVTVIQASQALTVSPSAMTFDYFSGSQNISVATEGQWTANSNASWLTLSRSSGTGNAIVEAKVSTNNSTTERTAIVTITSAGVSKTISVTQHGKQATTFSVTPMSLEFDCTKSSLDINVLANYGWAASSSASWLSISQTSGNGNATVSVEVVANNTESAREGMITFTCEGITKTVYVVQKAATMELSQSVFTFGSTPSKNSLTISSNGTWSVSSDATWLEIDRTTGKGNIEVTLSVHDNPSNNSRTCNVTALAQNGITRIAKVTQNGRYLKVSPNSIDFVSGGGMSESPIIVTTDGEWTYNCSDSWLTTKQEGNVITVTALENESRNSRSTEIKIELTNLKEGAISESITINQQGVQPDYKGHEYVDLGLPSGLKWATCNIGAGTPEEKGYTYAWGMTESSFESWRYYKHCGGSETSMIKYCTDSKYGYVDNKTTLEKEDDAAYVLWGGSWRMPTADEFNELLQNCTCIKTTQNNVQGLLVMGNNGNKIFLPATSSNSSSGDYWSSSLSTKSTSAYRMWWGSGSGASAYGTEWRYENLAIRAVSE